MPALVRVCSLSLVLTAVLLAVPQAAGAQDNVSPVQIDLAGFDHVGDSPHAPDIGKVQHSVQANGAFRRVVIGVWLNRSELAEGEQVNVYFNWRAGGEQYFGGDHLFQLDGNAPPHEDAYWTYEWTNGQWVTEPFNNPSVETYPNGRMYFKVDFHAPARPAGVGLRVSSYPAGAGQTIDYAPDANEPNMGFSLEPHGVPDPLEGCTYDGGCVGPASGPGNFGPGPNRGGGAGPSGASPDCRRAKRKLRANGRKLSRARRSRERATSRAVYQAQSRTVKRLKRRHARLKRSVAAKC
jgi:hypothetical protein